jgi:hypothetical protein
VRQLFAWLVLGGYVALVVLGCAASPVPYGRDADETTYLDQQVRGGERVLGQRFQSLADILPLPLANDAEGLAERWYALANGDIADPPCDEMRTAYEALGIWLRGQADVVFANPSIPLEEGLDWQVRAIAEKWISNDECKQLRLGSITPP